LEGARRLKGIGTAVYKWLYKLKEIERLEDWKIEKLSL
jgi:hypothetical protein